MLNPSRVCLFGEALFDEQHGAQFLTSRFETCLEFLRYCSSWHPELQDLMSCLFEMITIACKLYVQRVTTNPEPCETMPTIDRFKRLTEEIDMYVDMVGRHLLGWSYFVLAAESSTTEHRQFFLKRLESLHHVTKCGNIRRAIEQVQDIWTSQSTKRWTSLLGGPCQSLIM